MSHRTTPPLLLAATLMLCSAACSAAPDPQRNAGGQGERAQQMQARLKAADRNGDGRISRDEAQAGLPRLAGHFDTIDTDGDGQLTREELRTAAQMLRERDGR